jgi:hypothetical protein
MSAPESDHHGQETTDVNGVTWKDIGRCDFEVDKSSLVPIQTTKDVHSDAH